MGITDLQSQTTERSMLLCETLPGSTQSSTRPMTAPMPKKNDIVPLKALRPDFERPTMLEIGPAMVPAVGSDLVRTMDAAPGAATRPATAREATRTKDDLIGDGKSRKQSSQAIAAGKKVGGHAEAVLSVMREFFLTRPLGVMLEVFKNQDTDNSGSVDVHEFKMGLNKLNLGLTDRDMEAVFRVADIDGSGHIAMNEFVNVFRNDSFERPEFFWDQTRPRGLLERQDRIVAMKEHSRAKVHVKYDTDQLIEIIRHRVETNSVKEVFNALDGNRSGRVASNEIVDALREMEVYISDQEAQDVVAKINSAVNDPTRTSMTYAAFTRTFNRGFDVKEIGLLEVGVLEGGAKRMQPEIKTQLDGYGADDAGTGYGLKAGGPQSARWVKVWRDHRAAVAMSPSPRRQKAAQAEAAQVAARTGQIDEQDSLQRWEAMRTALATPEVTKATRVVRGKANNAAVEEEMRKSGMLDGRHDQMSAWRATDYVDTNALGRSLNVVNTIGKATVVGSGIDDKSGRASIDWAEYTNAADQQGAHARIIGEYQPLAVALDATMRKASPRSALDLRGDVRTLPTTRGDTRKLDAIQGASYGWHRGYPKAAPRDPIAPPDSTAICMYPAPNSAMYADDKTRLTPRPTTVETAYWKPPNDTHEHALKLRKERGDRIARRETEQLEAEQHIEAVAENHFQSLIRSKEQFRARLEEMQRIIESRHAEGGVEAVKYEPSFYEGTRPAQPHLTSHWNTISHRHKDPPPREFLKQISAFRKAFPEMDKRPLTDSFKPVWGGAR